VVGPRNARAHLRTLAGTHTQPHVHVHIHIHRGHSYFERATVKRSANTHAPVHAFMGLNESSKHFYALEIYSNDEESHDYLHA